MPQGVLLTNAVEAVLQDLAASGATGCLVVRDQEGDEAEVYLRDGQVYSVMVPGRRVMLGVRLMSRGALTPEALAEALEIQRTELQGWRLGELLVHLGYVELSVVEEFVVEHLKDALADLLGWPVSAWKFRKNKKTRQDVAPPTAVAELFEDLRDRATTWETILESIGGPESVPALASGPASDQVALGPNEWALLCKVDAQRSVADLAGECGFTLFEAGQVVTRLVEAGLVELIDEDVDTAMGPGAGPAVEVDVAATTEIETSAAGTEVLDLEGPDESGPQLVLPMVRMDETDQAPELAVQPEPQGVPSPADTEAVEYVAPLVEETVGGEGVALEEADDPEVVREREAAELHRQLEALAARESAAREERAAARAAAKAEQQEMEARREAEAAQAAAEEQARVEEEARAQAEAQARAQAEAEALAEQAAAELAAAEDAAHEEYQARLAWERAAAESEAWAEHEVWLAAQRARDEEQAWEEQNRRLAEEAAALAERAAREEAERQAAREQAERELQAEADRRAREAAEQEAARAAAEQEAARAAAEQEAARIAEQTAAREASERAAREAAEQDTDPDDVSAGAAAAARAASMLTELNRDASAAAPERPPVPAEPEAESDQADAQDAAESAPEPMVARDHADTAMLLRELSSLGFGADDDRTPPPAAPPRQTPPPSTAPSAPAATKKRKGLFGRG